MYQIAIGTINPNSYVTPQQVRNGSKITKLSLQIDYIDDSIVSENSTVDWYVWFNIGGTQARPNPAAINSSVIKNQVFHQDGTMTDALIFSNAGYGQPWKNSWRLEVNVPRSLQQINESDTIEFVIQGGPNTAHSNIKFRCIYKEIFP